MGRPSVQPCSQAYSIAASVPSTAMDSDVSSLI